MPTTEKTAAPPPDAPSQRELDPVQIEVLIEVLDDLPFV